MKKTLLLITLLSMPFILMAQTETAPTSTGAHMTPAEMKWGPGPPSLPPGAQLTVLFGDPSKEGEPFVMRGKFPAGYKVKPHYHPTAENLTVISGTFYFGMGDTFDMKAGHAYPAGSYLHTPAEMHHYAWVKGPTIIQIHGIGPFKITYVNPADDPRNSAQTKGQ